MNAQAICRYAEWQISCYR